MPTADDGEAPTGNFRILEAPTREAAQAFAEADLHARAGLVEGVEIVALANHSGPIASTR